MRTSIRHLNSKGFTLIEILMVVIIIAVLAGLAVPIYQSTVEKSRRAEAVSTLDALRGSELRYFSANNTYTTDTTKLDYDPTAATTSGQTVHFTYAVGAATTTTFSGTATRNAADGGDGTSTVSIDQSGAITGTGVFA